MVAIVAGNGLGLQTGSRGVLGADGALGQAVLGQNGAGVYVNAATGNLVLQGQDEILVGRGDDIGLVRTYNSQASFDFDNNDGWQLSLYKKLSGLSGWYNFYGSIQLTDADGVVRTFVYDSTSGLYQNRDGAGAMDTLRYDSGTNGWTYVDGEGHWSETFGVSSASGEWRILSHKDADGQGYTYEYDSAGLIAKVTNSAGEQTVLSYNTAKQLLQVELKTCTGAGAKTTLRVRYAYDASSRLQSVSTDLTPDDGSIGDGKTFVTTYAYDGTSKRVASVRNSDGTELAFAYDSSGRVLTITDGAGKKTTITYGASSTQVQDALGQVTTFSYDTNQQLVRIVGPSGSGVDQSYVYNANGDVASITDSRGNAVTCEYDTRGNLTRRQDAGGNVLVRAYSGDNLLLSESVNGQTTRYVYDAKQHLRFVLSPENRVTEYVYDNYGQRTREIQHGALLGEMALGTALLSQDFSSNASGFSYLGWDGCFTLANGKLVVTPKSGYWATDSIVTGSNTRPQGSVFQAEITLGPSAVGRNFTFGAQFATSSYAAASFGHRVVFDSNGNAVVLWSNGQDSTAVLGTVANGATYVVEVWTDAQGSTLYVYEKGKVRSSGWSDRRDFDGWSVVKSVMATPTGASGQIESPVYVDNYIEAPQPDLVSWLTSWSASADKRGAELTDYGYDARGQVSTVTHYTQVTLDGTPASSGATTTFVRDAAGRLLQSVDALRNASTYTYDGLGRLLTNCDATGKVTSTVYDDAGRRVTLQQAGGLRIESVFDKRGLLLSRSERSATLALSSLSFAYDALGRLRVATGADGGKTYYFYDAAGRKIAEIDPVGAYTEWQYNKTGQDVLRRRYANPVSVNVAALFVADADGQVANVAASAVRPAADASRDPISRSLYDTVGRLVLRIDDQDLSGTTRQSAVTRYTYDGAGRLVATISYANCLTGVAGLDGLGREAKPEDVLFISGAPSAGQIAVQLDATRDRVTRAFYSADGLLRGQLDAEGYLTEFFYDPESRQIGSLRYATATNAGLRAGSSLDALRPATAPQDQRTSAFYDSRGQVVAAVDADGYLTRYGYDANGNRTSTQRYADRVNDAQWAARNLEGLLPAGSAYRQTRTGYTALNQIAWQEDVDGTVTRFTYDADGRLLTSGRGWTFSGSTLVATDVRTRTQRYDLQGRLIGELDGVGSAALAALGASPTSAQVEALWASYGTIYAYDAAGRRTQRGDANGNVTLYFYDADNRLTYTVARVKNPDNAAEWLGEVSARQYDALGEVTAEIRYANRIAAAKMLTLTGGADTQVKAAGVIVADANKDSRTDTTYILAGQVKRSTVKLNATENAVTDRSYTAFGELSVRTSSLDASRTRREEFAYDRRGLLTAEGLDAAWSGNSGAIGATRQTFYDAFGRVLSQTDARAYTTTTEYTTDAASGRSKITVTGPGGLFSRSTTYDAFGRVLTQTDALGKSTTTNYAVDTATGKTTTTVTSPEGFITKTVSSRHGQVVTLIDGLGNETRYTYDLNGNLKTQEVWDKAANKLSQVLGNNYDTAGLLLKDTTDGSGNKVSYSYDAANRLLTRTVDPDGLKYETRYSYDAKGQLSKITDPSGVVTETKYDLAGRVLEQIVAPAGLALKTRMTYDLAGRIKTVTQGADSANAATVEYAYDSLGRRTTETVDPNGLKLVTRYQYDAEGRVVAKIEGDGTAAARTTRFVYDAAGRQIYTVDAAGNVVFSEYDKAGQLLKTTAYANAINLAGLANAIAAADLVAKLVANAGTDRVTEHIYDADGREVYTVDPAGYVTYRKYDGNARVVLSGRLAAPLTAGIARTVAGITAWIAAGNRLSALHGTFKAYDGLGLLRYSVDAQGYITEQVYDAGGQLKKVIAYAQAVTVPQAATWTGLASGVSTTSSSNDQVTEYSYDKAGRVKDLTDAVGGITHYDYDGAGRLTDTTTAFNTALAATLHRTYDGAGRLTAETRGYGSPDASTTRYNYNALNQQVAIVDPRGVELSESDSSWAKAQRLALGYAVSGRAKLASELSVADKAALAALYTTRQEFDAAGRKTASIDAFGNRTQTAYDAFGNIVKVTDPRGTVGYFYYDVSNRLVLQVDPAGGIAKTSYNAFGDVKSVIRYAKPAQGGWSVATQPQIVADAAHDQKTETTTDILGRRKEIKTWFGAGANDCYTESFTYDTWGNVTQAVAKNGAATSYEYDVLGRKTKEILPVTSKNSSGAETKVENRYEYDALGNLTKKSEAYGLPEQRVTVFGYDRLNRVVTETLKGVPLASGSVGDVSRGKIWDKAGNLVKETDFNGNATYRFYDAQNREIGTLDGSGAYVANSYDASGNRTARTAYANRVSGPATAGIRPTVFASNPTSTPANAWLLADAANDRVVYTTYDAANREIGTEIPNMEIGRYDGAAASYQIANASVTTAKVYDASSNLIKEVDANGNATWSVYDAAGRRVAQVDARRFLTTWEYDALGQRLKETRYANAVDASFTLAAGMTLSTLQAKVAASGDDRITVFAYDGAGRRLEERRKSVSHDAGVADSVTAYAYNGLNLVTRITNALGEVTDYSYDAAGRLAKVELPTFLDAVGTQVRERTAYVYDGLNEVTSETRLGKDDSKTSDDRTTTRAYVAGRLKSETDATLATWTYSYDANGNVVARSQQRHDADNVVYTVRTEYTYDGANRQLTTTDSTTGTVEKVAYNAFGEISQKGTNGFQQTSVYDRAGRLIATNSGGAWEAYRYDAAGKVTAHFASAGTSLQGAGLAQIQSAVANNQVSAVYSLLDAAGQCVALIRTGTNGQKASERQDWNAFGEVTSHTDALGNVERYTYNTLGKLTRREQPETAATLANGGQVRVKPTTVYTYDLAGNLLSTRDPNQVSGVADGSTRQVIRAGHVVEERHADGGVKSMAYNEFGEQVAVTDEIGKVTRYSYDAMGRLVRIDRPVRTDGTATYEIYSYDEDGQRIRHQVAQTAYAPNAEDKTEKTYFDSLGRIVKTASFTGVVVSTAYAWDAMIGGTGGWQKTITLADGKAAVDKTDAFGRLRWHQDYGSHTFSYTYDAASGWLTAQTGSSGQNIAYEYYVDGKLRRRVDQAEGMETRLDYDAAGRVVFETYGKLNGALAEQAQSATISYDELGRIKRVVDPKYTLDYDYDANGNRRRVKSVYTEVGSSTSLTQDYWYTFDAMNRFLVSQGSFTGTAGSGSIGRGAAGYAMSYNLAGQRVQQVGANGTETYDYSADGYLENTRIDGVLRAWRRNDAVGNAVESKEYSGKQVETVYDLATGVATYGAEVTSWHQTTYDNDNRAIHDESRSFRSTYSGKPLKRVLEDYLAQTVDTHYAADGTVSDTFSDQKSGTTVTTRYVYDWWDEAKTRTIKSQANNASAPGWAPGYSNFTYDANGHLRKVRDEVGKRDLVYVTDADGRILRRTETEYPNLMPAGVSRTRAYYFVAGRPVGEASVTPGGADAGVTIDYAQQVASPCYAKHIGPVNSADFDQNLQRIGPEYPGRSSGSYVVQEGDSLQGIALAVWGNANLWYLIADANGLGGDADLVAGMNLTLPNKVTNAANTSTTFRPYDPAEAMGDVQPTLPSPPPPPKKKSGCGGAGMIIVAIVAVVATIATAGVASLGISGAMNAGLAGTMSAGVTALGGTTVAGAFMGSMAASAIGGAVGSIAGQLTGMAIGIQDKFSWSAVATGALAAGATAGLGSLAGPGGLAGVVGAGDKFAAAAINASASNLVNQGVNLLTGQQKQFSWASLAASAIAAPIMTGVNDELFGPTNRDTLARTSPWATQNPGLARLAEAGSSSLISATTRVIISGGKVEWAAVAADALSSATRDYLTSGGSGGQQPNEQMALEDNQYNQGVTGVGAQSTNPDWASTTKYADARAMTSDGGYIPANTDGTVSDDMSADGLAARKREVEGLVARDVWGQEARDESIAGAQLFQTGGPARMPRGIGSSGFEMVRNGNWDNALNLAADPVGLLGELPGLKDDLAQLGQIEAKNRIDDMRQRMQDAGVKNVPDYTRYIAANGSGIDFQATAENLGKTYENYIRDQRMRETWGDDYQNLRIGKSQMTPLEFEQRVLDIHQKATDVAYERGVDLIARGKLAVEDGQYARTLGSFIDGRVRDQLRGFAQLEGINDSSVSNIWAINRRIKSDDVAGYGIPDGRIGNNIYHDTTLARKDGYTPQISKWNAIREGNFLIVRPSQLGGSYAITRDAIQPYAPQPRLPGRRL